MGTPQNPRGIVRYGLARGPDGGDAGPCISIGVAGSRDIAEALGASVVTLGWCAPEPRARPPPVRDQLSPIPESSGPCRRRTASTAGIAPVPASMRAPRRSSAPALPKARLVIGMEGRN